MRVAQAEATPIPYQILHFPRTRICFYPMHLYPYTSYSNPPQYHSASPHVSVFLYENTIPLYVKYLIIVSIILICCSSQKIRQPGDFLYRQILPSSIFFKHPNQSPVTKIPAVVPERFIPFTIICIFPCATFSFRISWIESHIFPGCMMKYSIRMNFSTSPRLSSNAS